MLRRLARTLGNLLVSTSLGGFAVLTLGGVASLGLGAAEPPIETSSGRVEIPSLGLATGAVPSFEERLPEAALGADLSHVGGELGSRPDPMERAEGEASTATAPVLVSQGDDGTSVGRRGAAASDRAVAALQARDPAWPAATPTPAPFLPITRVALPRLALDTEVVPAPLVEKDGAVTWEVPAFRVGHAQYTAGAGERGNAVLLGHVASRRSGDVFRALGDTRVGDLARIYSDRQSFEYRVSEVRRVPRTDVSVVAPSSTASVTLITCAGLWLPHLGDYAERLIVRAELIPSRAN